MSRRRIGPPAPTGRQACQGKDGHAPPIAGKARVRCDHCGLLLHRACRRCDRAFHLAPCGLVCKSGSYWAVPGPAVVHLRNGRCERCDRNRRVPGAARELRGRVVVDELIRLAGELERRDPQRFHAFAWRLYAWLRSGGLPPSRAAAELRARGSRGVLAFADEEQP